MLIYQVHVNCIPDKNKLLYFNNSPVVPLDCIIPLKALWHPYHYPILWHGMGHWGVIWNSVGHSRMSPFLGVASHWLDRPLSRGVRRLLAVPGHAERVSSCWPGGSAQDFLGPKEISNWVMDMVTWTMLLGALHGESETQYEFIIYPPLDWPWLLCLKVNSTYLFKKSPERDMASTPQPSYTIIHKLLIISF